MLEPEGQASTRSRYEPGSHSPEVGVCGEERRGQVRRWGGGLDLHQAFCAIPTSPTVRGTQRERQRIRTEMEGKRQTEMKKRQGDSQDKERDKDKEDFPGGAVVKNPPANAGDTGSSPSLGRSHIPRSN